MNAWVAHPGIHFLRRRRKEVAFPLILSKPNHACLTADLRLLYVSLAHHAAQGNRRAEHGLLVLGQNP